MNDHSERLSKLDKDARERVLRVYGHFIEGRKFNSDREAFSGLTEEGYDCLYEMFGEDIRVIQEKCVSNAGNWIEQARGEAAFGNVSTSMADYYDNEVRAEHIGARQDREKIESYVRRVSAYDPRTLDF